jgi:lactate 2-monooxygenase
VTCWRSCASAGAIGALDALPPVAPAAGSELAVLLNGGIRGGAAMVKALALGARAVLIGRPYAYGLALGGEDGVTHVTPRRPSAPG